MSTRIPRLKDKEDIVVLMQSKCQLNKEDIVIIKTNPGAGLVTLKESNPGAGLATGKSLVIIKTNPGWAWSWERVKWLSNPGRHKVYDVKGGFGHGKEQWLLKQIRAVLTASQRIWYKGFWPD